MMKPEALLATLPLLFLAFAAAEFRPGEPPDPDRLSSGVDELFRIYDRDDVPGCAVAAWREGESLLRRGFGSANLDYGIPISDSTSFYMASVSKQVTAASAALLVVRGELDPDAPVNDYLDEWPSWASDVKVHHLFDHTSGLSDLYAMMELSGVPLSNVMTLGEYFEVATRGEALMFEPGSQYAYTNTGYVTLALLVERIGEEPFSEFAERELLRPLGMTRTHFHDDRHRIVPNRAISYTTDGDGFRRSYMGTFQGVGPGGLYSTLNDWQQWERFWLDRIDLERSEGISVPEAQELRRLLTVRRTAGGEPIDYGWGLQLEEELGVQVHGHTGSFMGFRTDYRRYPEHGLATLTLCNRGDAEARELSRGVARLLLEESYNSWLRPLEGSYRSDELAAVWRFRVDEGRLLLDRRLPPDGPLRKEDGRWHAGSWELEFETEGERVTGFRVDTGRIRDLRFVRTAGE